MCIPSEHADIARLTLAGLCVSISLHCYKYAALVPMSSSKVKLE